jgi:large subunit ribosomal protein L9
MAKTANKPAANGETKAEAKTEKSAGKKKLPVKKIKRRRQVKKGPHGGTMVVLVNDLVHVGKQGDLVEVKPGYARNYLLPYGHAVTPTTENLRTLEQYKIKVQKAREAKIADLKVLAEQLTRLPAVTIEANATEEGHLYGSIGPFEISKTLKGKNLMVEPDMVKLENHIKEAKTLTEVPLSLGFGLEATIQVLVVALQSGAKK